MKAVVSFIAAWIVFSGSQQPATQRRQTDEKGSNAAQANSAPKQKPGQSAASPPSRDADTDSQRLRSNGNENVQIVTPAPEKAVDPVGRGISIIGVICTIALAYVGIRGIYIALGTLHEMKGQRDEMERQVRAATLQVRTMRKQITETSAQSDILRDSVKAAQEAATAAKTSADIAAGVAVPTLVVERFELGNMGLANIMAILQLPNLNIVIRNYGQTPALLHSWSVVLTCEELPAVPAYFGHPGSGNLLDKMVVQPNQPFALPELPSWRRQGFSLEDIEAILNHKKLLSVYGYVCYGDIFGNPLKRLKFGEFALNIGDNWIEWSNMADPRYCGTELYPADKKAIKVERDGPRAGISGENPN